ncbi:unnamed protein product, partial [Brenthis ino]
MENLNIRWAFNAKTWKPTLDQIVAASSYIQTEEKLRIARYVFQDDAKSSLIGRLLLRKFAHISNLIKYEDVHFGRDGHGKPYLIGIGDKFVNFNVSHQGDYVVLAGNTKKNLGIDVMKIEPPANKNIQEFFRIMNRQFSSFEWAKIRSYSSELEQVASFYRMWCLKESYVKNIGLGVTIPLVDISFCVKSELKVGELVTDTKLYVKNVLKEDWMFEETLLDDKHAVAVAIQVDSDEKITPVEYAFLTFDDVVKEAKPLNERDMAFAENFLMKEKKNF